MFNKEYHFRGKYSEIVQKLTDPTNGFKLLNRNLDALCLAPIIGFLYNRKAENDNSQSAKENITKILLDQLVAEKDMLDFNYRLIMLLHDKANVSIEERLNRAFRYNDKSEEKSECNQIFESYVLGGLEVLNDKLMTNAIHTDDYVSNMYKFVNDYNKRYEEISINSIEELCRKAGE